MYREATLSIYDFWTYIGKIMEVGVLQNERRQNFSTQSCSFIRNSQKTRTSKVTCIGKEQSLCMSNPTSKEKCLFLYLSTRVKQLEEQRYSFYRHSLIISWGEYTQFQRVVSRQDNFREIKPPNSPETRQKDRSDLGE
jgi:hypothetical protein